MIIYKLTQSDVVGMEYGTLGACNLVEYYTTLKKAKMMARKMVKVKIEWTENVGCGIFRSNNIPFSVFEIRQIDVQE
jgi:hypothetical protein